MILMHLESKRKKDRIQQLEIELEELKKKNVALKRQKVIRLDDAQIESILDSLTKRIEWSTNKVVDEMQHPVVINSEEWRRDDLDGFSTLLKWLIAITFWGTAIWVIWFLIVLSGEYWGEGWRTRLAIIIILMAGIDCLLMGVEIMKEKDRNYIVALFSSLIALVALIITLIE